MDSLRAAYGRLIRAPVLGPAVRLPMKLIRWVLRDPERDPSARLDRLTAEVTLARADLDRLALDNARLVRREEHLGLTIAMLSAMVAAGCDRARTSTSPSPAK